MQIYFTTTSTENYRGRPITTLPITLNNDPKKINESKIKLTSQRDLEEVRSIVNDRENWRSLIRRIRDKAEAPRSLDYKAISHKDKYPHCILLPSQCFPRRATASVFKRVTTVEVMDMNTKEILTIDSLLEHLGNCGPFQVVIVILLHGSILITSWSMMFMAYGNYNPGWNCADPDLNITSVMEEMNRSIDVNASMNKDDWEQSCDAYKHCENVVFENGTSTIVTEWELVCDRRWIPSLMISLQMAGVLIGTLSAGQLNLIIGRKATHFGTLALLAIFNLIASFSVNWPMFAACRFLVGITCGSFMLCAFVYPMEFVTNQWRGVVSALPFSSTGSLTFSLTAMLLRDWRQLHIATTILATVLALPVFWVPDSMRWLALKSKIEKAEKVGLKIARMNGKPSAKMGVFMMIAEKEREIEENKPHFTIIDLYRYRLLKRTLILTLTWVTNTIIYYVFIFDVKSLSGNFYINLMLFSVITIISLPFVPLMTNTIGRKWGIIVLMGLASVGCILLVSMNFVSVGIDKGLAKLILILIITIFIDAEWSILLLYCVELYPTVLRSLSYSHGSCMARIGGMVAPFLIPIDPSNAYISQLIMVALTGLTCVSLFFLPETKGQHLEESIRFKEKHDHRKPLEELS